MPISLKVQGKCLYYPSGDLKIVYGRPAGFFVTKKSCSEFVVPFVSVLRKKCKIQNQTHCFTVCISSSAGICEHIPAANVQR